MGIKIVMKPTRFFEIIDELVKEDDISKREEIKNELTRKFLEHIESNDGAKIQIPEFMMKD